MGGATGVGVGGATGGGMPLRASDTGIGGSPGHMGGGGGGGGRPHYTQTATHYASPAPPR